MLEFEKINIKGGTRTDERDENKKIAPIPFPLKCFDRRYLSIWLTIVQRIGATSEMANQLLCIKYIFHYLLSIIN
jgi:hypothetical protein